MKKKILNRIIIKSGKRALQIIDNISIAHFVFWNYLILTTGQVQKIFDNEKNLFQEAIKKGISDADAEARTFARK